MASVKTSNRQTWPRLLLVLTPEQGDALDELARVNYRDRRREAMRLLDDAIRRERGALAGTTR